MRKFSCLLMNALPLISGKLHVQTMEVAATMRIKGSKGAAGTSANAQGRLKTRVPINNPLIISGIVDETREEHLIEGGVAAVCT